MARRRAWMDLPHEFVEVAADNLCACGSLWEADIHADPVFACCIDPTVACCDRAPGSQEKQQ